MDFITQIADARGRKRLPEAIADIYIERQSLNLATTREDLLMVGLTSAEIDLHAGRARKIAAARCLKRVGKAA